jgi:DUF1009 family protein
MKSRRMTLTGHMARIGEGRGAEIVLVGKVRERDHLEDLAIDVRIIIKWISKKQEGMETGLMWLRIGTGGGLL